MFVFRHGFNLSNSFVPGKIWTTHSLNLGGQFKEQRPRGGSSPIIPYPGDPHPAIPSKVQFWGLVLSMPASTAMTWGMPASAAPAREASRNCTTSLILQRLPLKVCGLATIRFLTDLVRKCDPRRGLSLSIAPRRLCVVIKVACFSRGRLRPSDLRIKISFSTSSLSS